MLAQRYRLKLKLVADYVQGIAKVESPTAPAPANIGMIARSVAYDLSQAMAGITLGRHNDGPEAIETFIRWLHWEGTSHLQLTNVDRCSTALNVVACDQESDRTVIQVKMGFNFPVAQSGANGINFQTLLEHFTHATQADKNCGNVNCAGHHVANQHHVRRYYYEQIRQGGFVNMVANRFTVD